MRVADTPPPVAGFMDMGRVAACCTALVSAVMLAWAVPSAFAQSQVTVAGPAVPGQIGGFGEIVGPEVSGQRVVWAASREGGVEFRSLAADGRVSVVGGASGAGLWDLSLDGDRLAYSRLQSRCDPASDDCSSGVFLDSGEIAHGPVGGPYTPLELCAGSEDSCPSSEYCVSDLPIELAEGVLTHRAVCSLQAAVGRELATGATRTFKGHLPGYGSFPWSAYGRYIAFREPNDAGAGSASEIVVSDAITAEEHYRVDAPDAGFSVGEDGLLAVVRSGELSWASPEEPFLHPLVTVPPSSSVEVRRELIAVGTTVSDGLAFRVFDLAGHSTSQIAPVAQLDDEDWADYADWDFDGRRIAWEEIPCEVVTMILAWDVRDQFPTTPSGPCPAPTLARARKRLSKRGNVVLRLSCPAEPQLGCSGTVRLNVPSRFGGGWISLATDYYTILPGETPRVEITLDRDARRFIRRRPVPVRGKIVATRRDGYDTKERRRFRFRLAAR